MSFPNIGLYNNVFARQTINATERQASLTSVLGSTWQRYVALSNDLLGCTYVLCSSSMAPASSYTAAVCGVEGDSNVGCDDDDVDECCGDIGI